MNYKFYIFTAIIASVLACNSTLPITANPDHSTYANGAAGSAKITDGPVHEGPKTIIDTNKIKQDTLRQH